MKVPPQMTATSTSLMTTAVIDTSSARLDGESRGERAEYTGQRALRPAAPAGPACEPLARAGRRGDAERIAGNDDDELRHREHQALQQHVTAHRVDELRKKRELKHRKFGVEDRRDESLPVHPCARIVARDIRGAAFAGRTPGNDRKPREVD